jgi:hypothetical protein
MRSKGASGYEAYLDARDPVDPTRLAFEILYRSKSGVHIINYLVIPIT